MSNAAENFRKTYLCIIPVFGFSKWTLGKERREQCGQKPRVNVL